MNCPALIAYFVIFLFTPDGQAQNDIHNYATEEYYWRDYDNGSIPKDAVIGGVDKEGNPTYVGQVLHSASLIPGQIDHTYKNISYSYMEEPHTATQNVKILCSAYPERFEWIPTTPDEIRFLLPRKNIVIAGYSSGGQLGYPVVAGRAVRNGQKIVGRVYTITNQETIEFVEDGKVMNGRSYEVLSFNKYWTC